MVKFEPLEYHVKNLTLKEQWLPRDLCFLTTPPVHGKIFQGETSNQKLRSSKEWHLTLKPLWIRPRGTCFVFCRRWAWGLHIRGLNRRRRSWKHPFDSNTTWSQIQSGSSRLNLMIKIKLKTPIWFKYYLLHKYIYTLRAVESTA